MDISIAPLATAQPAKLVDFLLPTPEHTLEPRMDQPEQQFPVSNPSIYEDATIKQQSRNATPHSIDLLDQSEGTIPPPGEILIGRGVTPQEIDLISPDLVPRRTRQLTY
jgi:hypothetical protein